MENNNAEQKAQDLINDTVKPKIDNINQNIDNISKEVKSTHDMLNAFISMSTQNHEIMANIIKSNEEITGLQLKSNKIIFMNLDHYYSIFRTTLILNHEPEYFYNFKKFKNTSSEFNLAKIKINETTTVFMTLHLKQNRFFIKIIYNSFILNYLDQSSRD